MRRRYMKDFLLQLNKNRANKCFSNRTNFVVVGGVDVTVGAVLVALDEAVREPILEPALAEQQSFAVKMIGD